MGLPIPIPHMSHTPALPKSPRTEVSKVTHGHNNTKIGHKHTPVVPIPLKNT